MLHQLRILQGRQRRPHERCQESGIVQAPLHLRPGLPLQELPWLERYALSMCTPPAGGHGLSIGRNGTINRPPGVF